MKYHDYLGRYFNSNDLYDRDLREAVASEKYRQKLVSGNEPTDATAIAQTIAMRAKAITENI